MLVIPYVVKKSSIHSQGIFASKDIFRGKKIYEIQENELVQVPINEIKKWPTKKRDLFLRYSFQGDDSFYYSGILNFKSEEPIDDSFYMNHSCEPNCWHEGAQIVARRNIKKGEELTIDYGTIMAPNGLENDFACYCGSRECRKFITKKDCKNVGIVKKYKGHFPPFILKLTPYLSGKRT